MAQELTFGNNHGSPLVIRKDRAHLMYNLCEEGMWATLSDDLFSPPWGSILFRDKDALKQTIKNFNVMLEEWDQKS